MPMSTCAFIRVYILLVLSGPRFGKSRGTDDTLANFDMSSPHSLSVSVLARALPIHKLMSHVYVFY